LAAPTTEESGKRNPLINRPRIPKRASPDYLIPKQLLTSLVILSEAKNLAKETPYSKTHPYPNKPPLITDP
jgi:hypothetical protein